MEQDINDEKNLCDKDVIDALKKRILDNDVNLELLKKQILENSEKKLDFERPFDMLYLPSKGLFYKSKVDFLLLKTLSYSEENMLTSEFLFKSGKALEFIYKNLCINQDDISYDEILAGDMEAVCLFLRSSAYGDAINIELACQHCGTIDPEAKIRLSSFQMKEIHDSVGEDGFLTFKYNNLEIKVKQQTFKEAFQHEKNDSSETEKRASMIYSINGNKDKKHILKIMKSMNILPSREIKKFIEKNSPGVDAGYSNICSSCGEINLYNFGLGYKFLELPYAFRNTVLEEIFLVCYYGKGIDVDSAKKMSVYERKWFLTRINEELTKQKEAEQKEMNKAKNKSKSK